MPLVGNDETTTSATYGGGECGCQGEAGRVTVVVGEGEFMLQSSCIHILHILYIP